MVTGKERWSCVFVDRVFDNKIILTSPQKFGKMYTSGDNYRNKYLYSIPEKIGPVIGYSNENKLIKAIAIALGLNKNNLLESSGLVIRGHKGYRSIVASHCENIKPNTREEIIKGTTNWLIYISPQLEFFSIVDGKKLGPKLDNDMCNIVNGCIKEISHNWGR